MKKPITQRMNYLIQLITQVIADMNYLLTTYPEEEIKADILLLAEINQGYRAALKTLGERLEARGGWDFEI